MEIEFIRRFGSSASLHNAPSDSVDADLMFREGMQAYNDGDLPEALLKFRSALKINPQHRLSAEYVRLLERRLQLSIEQLTLEWHERFAAGDFAGAFETYLDTLAIKPREAKTKASLSETSALLADRLSRFGYQSSSDKRFGTVS